MFARRRRPTWDDAERLTRLLRALADVAARVIEVLGRWRLL